MVLCNASGKRCKKTFHHTSHFPLYQFHTAPAAAALSMSLTSTELNYLIWRYLQESGFDLAAYALEKHSNCLLYEHNQNLEVLAKVNPGCLVGLVQKGILYSLADEEVSPHKDVSFSLIGALLKDEVEKHLHNDGASKDAGNRFMLKSEAPSNGAVPELEMADAETENEPQQDPEEDFTTKIISPAITYSESLVTRWHPSSEVFAFGKLDSSATVNAIIDGKIAESVTLSHPSLIAGVSLGKAQNEINIVSWAPQGNLIVTAGANGELRAWAPDGKLKNIANGSAGPSHKDDAFAENRDDDTTTAPALISSLIWSENGQFLLSININNQVCLWNGTNLNLIQQIRTSTSAPSSGTIDACFVGDLKFAVSTPNKTIRIYSINAAVNQFDSTGSVSEPAVPIGILPGHERNILILKFNQVSKLLASSSDFDYKIKVWNSISADDCLELNNASTVPDVKLHTSPLIDLLWLNQADNSKGNMLLSISMEGVVNIWDAYSGKPIISTHIFLDKENFNLENPDVNAEQIIKTKPLVFAVALSPNNNFVAIGDDTGKVSVWDVAVKNYPKSRKDLLRCIGLYPFKLLDEDIQERTRELGICDLAWDSTSLKVSVSYKGTESVILNWAS